MQQHPYRRTLVATASRLPQLRLAMAVMSRTENAWELTYDTALKALTLMATAHTEVDADRASATLAGKRFRVRLTA